MIRPRRVLVAVLTVLATTALVTGCQADPVVLSGQLTRTADGTHPVNVQVTIYSNTDESVVVETRTTREGRYALRQSQLPDGTYRIRFSDDDWWDGGDGWAGATPVSVGPDGPVVVDETLTPATGQIVGTVTSLGKPLFGAGADATSVDTGLSVGVGIMSYPDLSFTITVPTGRYVVASGGGTSSQMWARGSLTRHDAAIITVTDGSVVNVGSLDLVPGWGMVGTVTGDGAGLGGIDLYVVEADGLAVVAQTTTRADGTFVVDGINGTVPYKVLVVDPDGDWKPVTWGADELTATGGDTFTIPIPPQRIGLGTQDLEPAD